MLKINEAAARLGVSARTIRFYEEKGLLTPAKIPHNGYRLYSEHDLLRLQTIMALREAGLALAELHTVLETYGMEASDELLYLLELQRSLLFAKRLDLDGQIRMNDLLIDAVRAENRSPAEEWIGFAEASRKERVLRHNWTDLHQFGRQAETFDAKLRDQNPEYPEYAQTLELLAELVNPREGETGVDLGTGTGNLAGVFLQRGAGMRAVDQSREMLRICRRKFPTMETKLGNLLSVPFFEGTFDFVVSSYVLHRLEVEERQAALKEMIRVLKPHGRIGLAFPMQEEELDPLKQWLEGAGYHVDLKAAGKGVILLLAEPLQPGKRSKS